MRRSWTYIAALLPGIVAMGVAIGCAVYSRTHSFSGQLRVATGHSENIAVREAPTLFAGDEIDKSVEASEVPFQDPGTGQKALSSDLKYDFMALPFSVTLKNVSLIKEMAPEDSLSLSSPGSKNTVSIAVGDSVTIEAVSYKVSAIQKWSGLLRESSGKPMLAISARLREGGPWQEDLFLETGSWRRLDHDSVVHFSWADSETAARDSIEKGLPGLESARWATVDRSSLNWFTAFTAGTGAQLADGTGITLMEVDEKDGDGRQGAAIKVQLDEGGKTREAWIAANDENTSEPVRFEYLAKLPSVVLVFAWEDGAGVALGFKDGVATGKKSLAAGDVAAKDVLPFEIRLDQVLSQAVGVARKDSPLYQAILKAGSRTLRFRQGEAVRVNDTLVQYVRKATLPLMRYQILAAKPGEKGKPITIGPDAPVRVGSWRLSQDPNSAEPLRVAVLRAEFRPGQNVTRIALAVALAAFIGAFLVLHEKSGRFKIDE